MENAGDESLVWQALIQRPLLDENEILLREPDIDTLVLAQGGGGVSPISLDFTLDIRNRLPFSPFYGSHQIPFFPVKFRRSFFFHISSSSSGYFIIFHKRHGHDALSDANDENPLPGISPGIRMIENIQEIFPGESSRDFLKGDASRSF